MTYTRKSFWRGAAERAIKTGAQVLASLITVGQAITEINWPGALAITATAAVASLLTSLADPDHADTAVATLGKHRVVQIDTDSQTIGKGKHHQ